MKKIKHFGVTLLVTLGCIFTSVASTSDVLFAPKASVGGRCICMDVYKPVCIIATGQQFPNDCYASCAGYSPKDWVDCSAQ